MKNELTKLNKHLKEKRPEYYKKLNKPLTHIEIAQLEEKYNLTLPIDLKELYLWKNGQAEDCYDSFVNNSMFEPLEFALQQNKELTEMIGYDFKIKNWWNKNWIPIFSNGGGSYICYDLEGVFTKNKGQLIEYWNKNNDRVVIFPSLDKLIKELNRYYENNFQNDINETFNISNNMVKWKIKFVVDKVSSE